MPATTPRHALGIPLGRTENGSSGMAVVAQYVLVAPLAEEGWLDTSRAEGMQLRVPVPPGRVFGPTLLLGAEAPIQVQQFTQTPRSRVGSWEVAHLATLTSRTTQRVELLLAHPGRGGGSASRLGSATLQAGVPLGVGAGALVLRKRAQEVA